MSDEAPEVAPVTPAPAEVPAAPDAAPAAPAPEADAPAVPAVEVTQVQPSSAQEETFVEEVVSEFVNIFDGAKRLVELVEQHRSIGDADVAAAVADVKQAVAANDPQPATDAPEA